MSLRLLLLTHFILVANALVPQQITFNAHHGLFSDNHHQRLETSKFIASDTYSLTYSDAVLYSRPMTVYRPRSLRALHDARRQSMQDGESPTEPLEWDVKEVLGPDVENRHTLAQLARMSGNAYALPGLPNWYEVDLAWNQSYPFGWEDEDDGFRGHVFLSENNSTIVLSIKGTTLNGPTSRKDRFNDNLLFSCCCARISPIWLIRPLCKCYTDHWGCDNTCIAKTLIGDSLFYTIGTRLMEDLIATYPDANIWLTGHSLGGALASLLGATYGFPAVTFESPGERLAASRLHLPLPPSPHLSTPSVSSSDIVPHPAHPHLPIFHVYHTSDPIPQGTCTGILSLCAHAGYALETKCHLGKTIVFDTVEKLGWHVDVRTHPIKTVIHRLLEDEDIDWGESDDDDNGGGDDDDDDDDDDIQDRTLLHRLWDWMKNHLGHKNTPRGSQVKPKRREVPQAKVEEDCEDCFKWEFGDFKVPGDDGGDDDDDDDDIPEPRDPNEFRNL